MGKTKNKILMSIWRLPIEHLVKQANPDSIERLFKDIDVWSQKFNVPYSGKKALLWLFFDRKEFRNLFYYRINPKCLGQKVHWWCPEALESLQIYVDDLGAGILFHHPFSTIINAKKIGNGCVIRNNTTIGNKSENQDLRPIIGDNVKIGPNTVVIGSVSIGKNVIIGAGSVVVKSFEDNCVIAGNPAKIIRSL